MVAHDPSVLRGLPLPTRLVAAAFLLTAAAGYVAALVQVHFQVAPQGALLPGPADVEALYSGGGPPVSLAERLLEAEGGPLNAKGSMRPAFTTQSRDWDARTKSAPADVVERLTAEREGERLALLSWIRAGTPRTAYDQDDYQLGADLAERPLSPELVRPEPAGHRHVRIRTLLAWRCVDCHGPADLTVPVWSRSTPTSGCGPCVPSRPTGRCRWPGWLRPRTFTCSGLRSCTVPPAGCSA
jgi:hypothetical protein